MSKNKGGRPTKEESERLKNRAMVRFTNAELSFVKAQADRAGLPLATYLNQAAMEQTVAERISPEMMVQLRQLFGIANNLNQAMHLANSYNLQGLATQVRRKLDDVLNLIHKIRMS